MLLHAVVCHILLLSHVATVVHVVAVTHSCFCHKFLLSHIDFFSQDVTLLFLFLHVAVVVTNCYMLLFPHVVTFVVATRCHCQKLILHVVVLTRVCCCFYSLLVLLSQVVVFTCCCR